MGFREQVIESTFQQHGLQVRRASMEIQAQVRERGLRCAESNAG